jgi:hypothetical protein
MGGKVKYKRCGAMPGTTEPIPRLLSTHLFSQVLLVGNSEIGRGLKGPYLRCKSVNLLVNGVV